MSCEKCLHREVCDQSSRQIWNRIMGEIECSDFIDESLCVEVVHGKWIPVDGKSPCDEWDCTACEQRRTFLCEMDIDEMKENYPYCPSCGAKMDGGNENDNI